MKLTSKDFRDYKDILVDLMIDNLNDDEILNAKSIGEDIRTIQGCINRNADLPEQLESMLYRLLQ